MGSTDINTAEDIANAFDRIDEENQRDIERVLKHATIEAATKYGVDDWRTVGVAVGSGLLEAGYKFLALSGRGLVDVLRLGESIRKPSAGAVFRDGVRILTIIPLGRVLKTGSMALGARAAVGGPMSCVVTGNTVAMRMSGTRLFITLDELWQSAGRAGPVEPGLSSLMSPVSPTFPGLQSLRAMVPAIKSLGATVTDLNLTSIEDVAGAASQGRGPVPFGVTWWRPISGLSQPAGRHMMVAFRGLMGEVMIADQGGVRSLAQFMSSLPSGISFGVEGGYLVEYASWINDAEALQRALQFGSRMPYAILPGTQPWGNSPLPPQTAAAQDMQWFGEHLEMPLYHLPGPVAFRLDSELRAKLHRRQRAPRVPTPSHPAAAPYLWDDPNLEGADPKTRRVWLALAANGGKAGSYVSASDLLRASGVSDSDFETALSQLEFLYRRIHVYQPALPAEAMAGRRIAWTYR